MSTFYRLPAVVLGAALTLQVLGSPFAWAQSYPTKPIRIIVPFGAGGIADFTARAVAQKMSESLRQPVVIENRPGAGGIVASQAVATAEPDGHTLLLMSNGNAVSAGLFKSLPYDTVKDLAPISTLGFFDIAIVTRSNSPFRSLGDLFRFARANPGKLNIGTINIGSTQNLAAELFKGSAALDAQVVPFNGTPALMSAVLGGSVDVAVEILGPVMPQVAGKSMRVLALMGDKRREAMPDVPTVQESGIEKFNVSSWNALAAPANTPREIVALLSREVQSAVSSPPVKARLAELGVEARASTPEQAQELLASEIRRWSDVIAKAGIEKQ